MLQTTQHFGKIASEHVEKRWHETVASSFCVLSADGLKSFGTRACYLKRCISDIEGKKTNSRGGRRGSHSVMSFWGPHGMRSEYGTVHWAEPPSPPILESEPIPLGEKSSRIQFWQNAPPFSTDNESPEGTEDGCKMTVLRVERDRGCCLLHGRHHTIHLSGSWAACDYHVGARVVVRPCLCCRHRPGAHPKQLQACPAPQQKQEDMLCKGDSEHMGAADTENQPSASNTHTNIACACSAETRAQQDAAGNGPIASPCAYHKALYYISDTENYLLVEDDIIPVTRFCSALECINGPLMHEWVADIALAPASPALAFGTLCHALLEYCLNNGVRSAPAIIAQAKRLIHTRTDILLSCAISPQQLLNELLKHMRVLVRFLAAHGAPCTVEHAVISDAFGLKGNIDCVLAPTAARSTALVEVKSGRFQAVSHRMQLMLYALLYAEKHNLCTEDFRQWLYYITGDETTPLTVQHHEVIALLQMRNRVAEKKEVRSCSCPETQPCAIYQRITALPADHFLHKQLVGIEEERASSMKYVRAVKMENSAFFEHAPTSAATAALDRPQAVRVRAHYPHACVMKVAEAIPVGEYVLVHTHAHCLVTRAVVEAASGLCHRLRLRDELPAGRVFFLVPNDSGVFYRHMMWSLLYVMYPHYTGNSLLPFSLPPPPATLSTAPDTDISFESEMFSLRSDADDTREPSLTCSDFVLENSADIEPRSLPPSAEDDNLALDSLTSQEQPSNANGEHSVNIDTLNTSHIGTGADTSIPFLPSSIPAEIAFNIIDSDCAPKDPHAHFFSPSSVEGQPTLAIPPPFRADFLRLNAEQQNALFQALNCPKYTVIHGMPGTGKSTLIALLIRILAHHGHSVLVTCYTHLAIDNIIARLGSLSYYRTNHSLALLAEESAGDWLAGAERVIRRVREAQTVLGTCFSFNDPVFVGRRFDYCIIDEGSQMHLPLALIPVSLSGRFCIVGDHLQLSPLARVRPAGSDGAGRGDGEVMGMSLFEYLPGNRMVLQTQYRMGKAIVRLSNALFYGGRLRGAMGDGCVEFVDTALDGWAAHVPAAEPCVYLCYFNDTVRQVRLLTACPVSTIDKYQGSEADSVCVIFDPIVPCEIMASRQRLNVALTRARKRLVLIGNRARMAEIPALAELLRIL